MGVKLLALDESVGLYNYKISRLRQISALYPVSFQLFSQYLLILFRYDYNNQTFISATFCHFRTIFISNDIGNHAYPV